MTQEQAKTGASPCRWYLRGRWIAVWTLAFISLLAVASLVTTDIEWVGGFPPGEFRLSVRGPDGAPISGAILRVYRRGTQQRAHGYPLGDYASGEAASDANGRISLACLRGAHFGGRLRYLFWLIPLGNTKGPKFDCVISANGFKPCTFPVERLYAGQFEVPKTKVDKDRINPELRLYEHNLVLERQ